MKKISLVLCYWVTTSFANAQIVDIPDTNFKNYLLDNFLINTNRDREIQISEALAFTGTIDCPKNNITDITGIEAFENITGLSIFENNIINVDLSNNKSLTYLLCMDNKISKLDISNNINLEYLGCVNNQLTELDVSQNLELKELFCSINKLKELDVSNNLNLKSLAFYGNDIKFINLNNNNLLGYLSCSENKLTELDVSNNILLDHISCDNNLLSELNTSQNPMLRDLYCNDNKLTKLNIKNNFNNLLINLDATGNINLSCIEIDNNFNAQDNNWLKDATAEYSTNCLLNSDYLAKNQQKTFPNPVKDNINFSEEFFNITILDFSGKIISKHYELRKQLNVSTLDKGNYIITAETKHGRTISYTFIKN